MPEWSLYEKEQELKPLIFSNGKSQADVVNEVLRAIGEGYKIIFIKGVCGTGKSAIALNIAKEIGRASIVVPIKNLQKQYEDDYTNKKHLLKNREKLKISVITGRANHSCQFIKENFLSEIKDANTTLSEFSGNNKNSKAEKNSADNHSIPCKIEIKEKNIKLLREYLRKNKQINSNEFLPINKIRRMSIAPVCPYWSPLVPSEINISLENSKKFNYKGLENIEYTFYQRGNVCSYYNQYLAYVNSDVLIFNSHKYKLECLMNRKPATDIEIIDECDEFLDSFSSSKKINLNRLNFVLSSMFSEDEKTQRIVNELVELTTSIIRENKEFDEEKIITLKNSKVLGLLSYFFESNFLEHIEADEENYCYYCDEVARTFEALLDESFISFHKEDKDLFVKIVTINLDRMFAELLNKNKIIVMMSGTIHSPQVLKDIFGLSNFKIIDAETRMPGKITCLRTGLEINCKYENFRNGQATREKYLLALNKCVLQAIKPVLVHVNSFSDLPSLEEAEQFNLSIITREKFIELQNNDFGELIKKFKNKEIDILYSTKCNRGVDFPGDSCNSIILTRYPYPNISSLFWRILKQKKPEYYREFYMDKAKREFLQRIYRGLRSEKDHIYLLSPDIRVFWGFEEQLI